MSWIVYAEFGCVIVVIVAMWVWYFWIQRKERKMMQEDPFILRNVFGGIDIIPSEDVPNGYKHTTENAIYVSSGNYELLRPLSARGTIIMIGFLKEMSKGELFEELVPECDATVNVTTFRYQGKVYTISTTDITSMRDTQRLYDIGAGYGGETGNYETMLFIDGDSMVYPFGDLPGHARLGVFQRYAREDSARDGHQDFVTRVKRTLLKREQVSPDYDRR